MITLPTPEQLVINGLKYFLRMNEKVQVGQLLAPLYHPDGAYREPSGICLYPDGAYREPSGICLYVKVNIWWFELPEYYKDGEQRELSIQAENLIDKLIKPYLAPEKVYLPDRGRLTEERLKIASRMLFELQGQQDDQG
jgi:hypothetical protein